MILSCVRTVESGHLHVGGRCRVTACQMTRRDCIRWHAVTVSDDTPWLCRVTRRDCVKWHAVTVSGNTPWPCFDTVYVTADVAPYYARQIYSCSATHRWAIQGGVTYVNCCGLKDANNDVVLQCLHTLHYTLFPSFPPCIFSHRWSCSRQSSLVCQQLCENLCFLCIS